YLPQFAFGWTRSAAEKLPVQIARRVELQGAAGYAVNDLTGPGCLGAEYEGVPEGLRPFAGCGVELVVFRALCSLCDQLKRCCSGRMRIGGAVGECSAVGAAVMRVQVVSEPAVLQAGLIGGDHQPIAV